MANKEKYIDGLRSQYADAPDEFLELCWLFHDCDKAKKYADLLYKCTSYADIAEKAVCPMYVSGDIDETRARSEKFLSLLIPLACLETGGNAHAAVYHVRQMLDRFLLVHGTREIASEFLRQAEARDEGGKRLMLPSVLDHLSDMMALQHTDKGSPVRSRALQLEQRFVEIEAKILSILEI